MEILIIVIVYIIYKLFSFSNEGNELENIGDVTPSLEINYEKTDGSKKQLAKKTVLKIVKNLNLLLLNIYQSG